MPQLNRSIYRCLFLAFASVTSLVTAQTLPITSDNETDVVIADIMRETKQNNYDPLKSQERIPLLKETFSRTTNPLMKEKIASVLVSLRDKDETYWSVLSKRAQEIVDSPVPYPLSFDANGKGIRGTLSPEFLEWVKSHNLSQDDALIEQMQTIPGELSLLAITGDPRGAPLLRKGLSSPNYGVKMFSARGLALLQDRDSIPLIIEAARKAPSELGPGLAQSLVSFDDPRARSAAEELISDRAFLEDLKQRVREKGARGIQ